MTATLELGRYRPPAGGRAGLVRYGVYDPPPNPHDDFTSDMLSVALAYQRDYHAAAGHDPSWEDAEAFARRALAGGRAGVTRFARQRGVSAFPGYAPARYGHDAGTGGDLDADADAFIQRLPDSAYGETQPTQPKHEGRRPSPGSWRPAVGRAGLLCRKQRRRTG
jgi:hypothetical protein